MTYHIGQTLPLDSSRCILTDEPCGRWFIFRVPSLGETRAEAWLGREGIEEAWHPTETRWRSVGHASRRRKVQHEVAVAPGYVFARFSHMPRWHVLFERSLGRLIGVVGSQGVPRQITDETLAEMRQVPTRIRVLREQAEAEERAARLARMPVAGEAARIVEGPLAGRVVDVTTIDRGLARFLSPLFSGVEMEMDVGRMERVSGEDFSR